MQVHNRAAATPPPPPAAEAGGSFARFYAAEYRRVAAFAYVLAGSWEAAEDLAQDAFAAVHARWGRVASYDDPAAHVRRLVANRAVSLRRRWRSDRDKSARLGRERLGGGEGALAGAELWALVRALPRRQAQVVALHYLEDRPVAEVARILGIDEATAKTHLRRARTALARQLGEDA